jgi:hypothetical protein
MEWISLKDRLPETDVQCLWYDGENTMFRDSKMHIDLLTSTHYGFDCVVNYLHNYTHWMPLPPAPEVEQ